MDLQQTFTAKGYFNPADNRENQLVGTVTFSQETGIDVSLMGQFDITRLGKFDHEIMHGFTSKGKKLTLLKPYTSSRSGAMPGIFLSEIGAQYMLIGDHFASSDELIFESIRFTCVDLNYWLNISGFEKPLYARDTNEVTIKYKKPETKTYFINADFELHIEFDYYGPAEWYIPDEKVSISQIPYFRIISTKQKKSFKQFIELYHQVLSFLSLGYFGYPIVKECVLRKVVNNEEYLSENEIEVYYQSGVDASKYSEHHDRHKFLFRFTDMQEIFPGILSNWVTLKEKTSESLNILTELFMYRPSPVELRFLSLTQAYESFHRKVISSKEAIFKVRLDEIMKQLPPAIIKVLIPDHDKFILDIKHNRNYFTHYDEKLMANAARLGELYILSEKMKIILIAITLKQLALSDKQVSEIILKNGAWLFNHLLKPQSDSEGAKGI